MRRIMKKKTIRLQLIKYIGLFIIFPLCMGLMALNIYLQKITEDNKASYDISAVSQIRENADQMIEIINYATSMMMTNEEVMEDIRDLNGLEDGYRQYQAKSDLAERLSEMESSVLNPVEGKIAVLTSSGYLIGSYNLSRTSVDYKDKEWYRKILANGRKTTFSSGLSAFFSEMAIYDIRDRQYLYIGRTIKDYSGKNLGIIIAQMSEEKIWGNFVREIAEDSQSALYLYDRDGELQMKRGDDGQNAEELYRRARSWENGAGSDIVRVRENDHYYISTSMESADNLLIYSIPVKLLREESSDILQGILFMILALIFLAVATMIYFSGKLSRPITSMVTSLDSAENGVLKLEEPRNSFYEVHQLITSYNAAGNRIEELIEKVKKESMEKEKNRYEMLMSQISPHFIFNTVNSIRIMAEQNSRVERALGALGTILHAVYTNNDGMTTVGQETALIQAYVDIMKMRFGDTFQYSNFIPTELYLYEIPAFTLQPIVENAILHGIKGIRYGQIIISAVEYDKDFIISVFNNGNTADEKMIDLILTTPDRSKSHFTSIGLYNVNSRFKMLYGERYGLIYKPNQKAGFEIWIRIPKRGDNIYEKSTDR